MAAELEGVIIDPVRIGEALATISAGKDLVVVEGAGGLMVPLRGGYLISDLARQLGLPLLVVSRATLGTINHTLLTIMAARSMGLPLAGFVINRMPVQPGPSEEAAPHLLAALASADLLGVFPDVAGTPESCVDQLADALDSMPTLPWLLHAIGLPPTHIDP
jgi:dethiobiotin synthetase